VLVDGFSPVECYYRWADNRACVERGGPPLYKLTAAQIEVGRRAYQTDCLAEHAAQLRAKVDASREAERNRVRVDVQDID
jgi:hypothetical protein